MSVAVIVPWRDGCLHRRRAWRWIRDRYSRTHPEWPIVLAEQAGEPWVKAAAVMPAALASGADVLVITDADVWCDGIDVAVRAVEQGAAWAVPHRTVRRFGPLASARLLAGAAADELATIEPPYRGVAGGGLIVIRRTALQRIPLDPRFEGWGGEDQAWGYALTALVGPPWRGARPLLHLWHPPQPRASRNVGSDASERLRQRYRTASRAAMAQIIAEIHQPLATARGC